MTIFKIAAAKVRISFEKCKKKTKKTMETLRIKVFIHEMMTYMLAYRDIRA